MPADVVPTVIVSGPAGRTLAMPKRLSQHPVHLGLGATAEVEPEFSGVEWYEAYGARHRRVHHRG